MSQVVKDILAASKAIQEATRQGKANAIWLTEDAAMMINESITKKESADNARKVEEFLNRNAKNGQN